MSRNPNVYISDDVGEVIRLHQDLFTESFPRLSIRDQLDLQARRILAAHQSHDATAATHICCWHPELVGHSVNEIMNHRFELDDARQTIAREYGFDDWADAETRGQHPPDHEFESAVDALLRGDADDLGRRLAQNPDLATQRSCFGHRSTLLHYVGSNGVETYRQVVPLNLPVLTQAIIDAGADVNATAEMYGGGSTTIGLLITSCHPAEAGVVDQVVQVLVDAGAETSKD